MDIILNDAQIDPPDFYQNLWPKYPLVTGSSNALGAVQDMINRLGMKMKRIKSRSDCCTDMVAFTCILVSYN